MNDQTKSDSVEKIAACPFCGADPDWKRPRENGERWVQCENSACFMSKAPWSVELEWNRRALPPSETAQEAVGYLYWQRLPCGGGHFQHVETFSRQKPLNIDDPEPLYAAPPPQPVSETAAQASVPEGWQLVPTEPTRAMANAGWNTGALFSDTRMIHDLTAAYCAMLAAAPRSTETEIEDVEGKDMAFARRAAVEIYEMNRDLPERDRLAAVYVAGAKHHAEAIGSTETGR